MAANRDVIAQDETWNRSDRTALDMTPARTRWMGSKKAAATTGTSSRSATTAVSLQRPRRLPGREAAPGERIQRGRLGGLACARDRPPAGRGTAGGVPGRRPFARRAIYAALEARGVGYAIRIPATRIWSCRSKTSYFGHRVGPAASRSSAPKSFQYQADSCQKSENAKKAIKTNRRRSACSLSSCFSRH